MYSKRAQKVLDRVEEETDYPGLHEYLQEEIGNLNLTDAWFHYGNNGPEHTHQNHLFIQRIIEQNEYDLEAYDPTEECVEAIDKIIYGHLYAHLRPVKLILDS